jgi:hypothetical protein
LAAAQSGNSVLITFAVPQNSVDGTPLEHPPAIQIYRDFELTPASGKAQSSAPKHPTLLSTIPSELVSRYVAQGEFRYADQLNAADFTNHPDSAIIYSVRTHVAGKKLSAPSNFASLRVYPAPDPISDLKGQVTPAAVVLSWTAPQQTPVGTAPPVAAYRIYRAEAQDSSVPSANGANSAPSPLVQAPARPPTSLPGIPPSPPALKAPLVKIGEIASPGFMDTTTEFGKKYVYSVRSVVNYPSAQVESGDSNFLAITPHDTFPPAAPAGLIGIFVPAVDNAAAHVDLSWAVSPEPDLAGYHVYRSEQAGVLGTSLTGQLLLTPAFRDMNVASGHRYFYTVTAVDRSGNESSPSAAVPVNVP